MSRHLDEHELTTAGAGLDLKPGVREHLAACLVCRRQVTWMQELLVSRRAALAAQAPDWQVQRQQILDRLPAPSLVAVPVETAAITPLRPRRWFRPALALAATMLLAVAAVVLVQSIEPQVTQVALLPSPSPQLVDDDLAVEEILAEVDAILADSSFPGFEPLGQMLPSNDELESYVRNPTS